MNECEIRYPLPAIPMRSPIKTQIQRLCQITDRQEQTLCREEDVKAGFSRLFGGAVVGKSGFWKKLMMVVVVVVIVIVMVLRGMVCWRSIMVLKGDEDE